MSAVTKRRIARQDHHCGCGQHIPPGDAYLEHTLFPGFLNDAKAPSRQRECARCAERYGRVVDVDPPYEQCARQGLF